MPNVHRRSIRLKGYDYTQVGAYHVTICVHQRSCWLGEVVEDEMRLSALGQFVAQCWENIPEHFPNVELDEWIVMPNHIHEIVVINEARRTDTAGRDTACRVPTPTEKFGKPVAGSLPTIIRSFKSAATKLVNAYRHTPEGKLWQRNYYEQIIRNAQALANIQRYIRYNPNNWQTDQENPIALKV